MKSDPDFYERTTHFFWRGLSQARHPYPYTCIIITQISLSKNRLHTFCFKMFSLPQQGTEKSPSVSFSNFYSLIFLLVKFLSLRYLNSLEVPTELYQIICYSVMDTICDRLLITIQTYPFLFLIPITSAMNYLSNIMFGGVQSGSIGGDSIIIRSNKTTAQFSTKIGNLERLSRAEEIR